MVKTWVNIKGKNYDTGRWATQVRKCPICYWGRVEDNANVAGPKQKWHSVLDVSGGESKILCYKQQYCATTAHRHTLLSLNLASETFSAQFWKQPLKWAHVERKLADHCLRCLGSDILGIFWEVRASWLFMLSPVVYANKVSYVGPEISQVEGKTNPVIRLWALCD